MESYAIYQPYTEKHSGARSKQELWRYPTRPSEQELAIIIDAARRRYENPQPGGGIDFEGEAVVRREKAIRLGETPVVYFFRTVDTIDLSAEPTELQD